MPETDFPSAVAARRLVAATRRPLGWLGRSLFDLEISGREHVAGHGGAVLTANHLSLIDPVLVTLAAGRNVRYLALDELFGRSRLFDRVTLMYGAIPMSRTRPPFGALQQALVHLEGAGLVGVFPEGRRVAAWGENPLKRGAAWLAFGSGVPLLPVAIHGSQGSMGMAQPALRRTPIRIWIEPPLIPDDYLDRVDPLQAMMEDWRAALERRLGPWAGRPGNAPPPPGGSRRDR